MRTLARAPVPILFRRVAPFSTSCAVPQLGVPGVPESRAFRDTGIPIAKTTPAHHVSHQPATLAAPLVCIFAVRSISQTSVTFSS